MPDSVYVYIFEYIYYIGIPTRKKLGSQCTRLDSLKMLWEESEKACGSWTI